MQENYNLSIPPRLIAWLVWLAMIGLLVAYVLTGDLRFGVVALALSAIAATLHMHSFCLRVQRSVRVATEVVQRNVRERGWVNEDPKGEWPRIRSVE